MSENYFKKWGFKFYKLSVTWYDLWDEKFILEIFFGNKKII